jgi:peptidoglycan/LPS O-acetylase OafA/YrhL
MDRAGTASSSTALPQGERPASSGTRLPGLDGIRAFAIAWVFISHLRFDRALLPGTLLAELSREGMDAVTLFFVVSGFLITTLLLREEDESGTIGLRDYFLRRGFRILPAALTYLGIMLAVMLATGAQPTLHEWLGSLLFYRNLVPSNVDYITGHFWSLSVEEQFYLLWPPLIVLIAPQRRLPLTILLIALAPVWRYVAFRNQWAVSSDIGRLDMSYDSILTGALLAQLQRLPSFRQLLNRFPYPGFLLAVGCLGFLTLSIRMLPAGNVGVLATPTVQNLCALLILGVLVEARSAIPLRLLEWSPVVWLGRISYSLYLWHIPFVHTWIPDFPGHLLVRVVLSLTAAWLSYRFIEQPMLRLRQRFLLPSHGSGT